VTAFDSHGIGLVRENRLRLAQEWFSEQHVVAVAHRQDVELYVRLVGIPIRLINAQLGAHGGGDAVRGAIRQRDWHVGGSPLFGCSEVFVVESLG
jgi:hypothetical protein